MATNLALNYFSPNAVTIQNQITNKTQTISSKCTATCPCAKKTFCNLDLTQWLILGNLWTIVRPK